MHKKQLVLLLAVFLTGCSSTFELDDSTVSSFPENWSEFTSQQVASLSWQEIENEAPLKDMIAKALGNNRTIQKSYLDLQITKQQSIIAGADLLPSLTSSLDYSKRQLASQNNSSAVYAIGFDLKYEVDIWGKLSASNRQANLSFLSAQAQYQQQLLNLIASISKAWFNLVESQKQLQLQNERSVLTNQSLDIIEKGYRQGLNSALDVYLARTELNSEQAKLFELQNTYKKLQREFKTLLGEYPDANINLESDYPNLTKLESIGLPSDVIKNKPAIVASWYKLLAQDAALAFAHKQRFPSFNLSLSLDSSNESFSEAIRFDQIGWNFLAGLTMPIFNAGRLSANEEKQRLTLKSEELSYLDEINKTFKNIENSLASEQTLKARLNKVKLSADNAKLAATLSFEQYLKGLVSYTTVLDAQKRSFDAQSNLISINNQLLQNRFTLYQEIGGEFNFNSQEQ